MSYFKILKNIIISILTFSLIGITFSTWNGLTAEKGDNLLIEKWNELVNKVLTLENENSSVLQTHIFSDYTRRGTSDGGYYYFGGTEFSNSITPKKADSIIEIDINYFGEATSHNASARLQYSIDGGAWTNFDLASHGQKTTLKLGSYPDTDYNSTPHNYSTTVAKVFSSTGTISFRMYHHNNGTFYHNNSKNSAYESGPSTLILRELNSSNSSYTKR